MPPLIPLTVSDGQKDTFFSSKIHTGSFCPGLFRWFAGLASPDGVAR